ncbi:NlpC/P60 family protein [Streptomyces sp. B6B3]|uniref:C40 family peptidase n=1 Tax=Streptomyces sp. B6B3 TaxID=3153570 RepID=UPI00325E11E1
MVCHRRPPQAQANRALVARVTVIAAAVTAATAVAAMTAVPVLADPGRATTPEAPPADSSAAAAEVDRLLASAERAVEAYNGTAERVAELQAEVARRQERVARGQEAVNEQRRALGTAAAAQYRAGGIDPSLALMLSGDPDGYLDRATTLDRISDRQSGQLRELLAAQRTLERRRAEAEDALEELAGERDRLADRRRAAEERLAEAREHYERLSAEERAERQAREERQRAAAALSSPSPVPTPAAARTAPPPAPVSSRAAAAVAAAQSVLGAPYGWGQAGPDAFDCSGLIQWSYAQAGVALPRTSQGQAGAGPHVSLDQAQPGDIVVYRSDASHVGMYVGDGQIVHSPHPGATVRYDPVGIMPVSAVVRP